MKKFYLTLILIWIGSTTLSAEIAPEYYAQMQAGATEQLRITPVDVSRDWYFWRSVRKVKVRAKVVSVTKSSLGLKPGQMIYFEYETYSPSAGWAGPRPMPLLTEGAEYDFYGEAGDSRLAADVVLNPVARGYSFEKVHPR
jgi:hypothetical protein